MRRPQAGPRQLAPSNFPSALSFTEKSPHAFRPDLRPQRVDERERALAFHVPEGPAVAGLQALRQRADAVDRAHGTAERNGAVGAHQRLVPFAALIERGMIAPRTA